MKNVCRAAGSWLLATAVVALACCAPPSSAHASSAKAPLTEYRLVLKSGEELPSVTFLRDDRLKVLRLQTPTKDRAIGYLDVQAIYEGERDVTRDVLGAAWSAPAPTSSPESLVAQAASPEAAPPPTPGGKWMPEQSEEYRSVDALRWHGGMYAGANFSVPIGSYYDGFTSGVGFDVEGLMPVARHLGVRASFSRSGIHPGSGLSAGGLSASILRYAFSMFYFQHPKRALSDFSMVYAYAGLGAGVHSLSAYGGSNSTTRFLMTTGVGYVHRLGSSLGLNGSVGMDEVFVPATAGNSASAFILDLKSGLVVLL